MVGKKNKIPYFLWINKPVITSFSKEIITIKDDETGDIINSKINVASKLKIFIIKHLPIVIIFISTFKLFSPFLLIVGLLSTILGVYLLFNYTRFFNAFIVLICVGGLQLVFNDLELLVEEFLYVTFQFALLFFLTKDIFSLIYQDVYFSVQEIGLNNHISKLNFGGYYLKVKSMEIKDENKTF